VAPHSNTHTPELAPDRADTVLDDYLSPAQLAAQLGICRRTLDRWRAARAGPPRVTIGRRPFYRRQAVSQWLLKRETDFDEPEPQPRRRPGRPRRATKNGGRG
jgi:hypothetical protein